MKRVFKADTSKKNVPVIAREERPKQYSFNLKGKLLLLAVVAGSCSPKFEAVVTGKLQQAETIFQHHSGFCLYDIQRNKQVVAHNADRYFTPASNTKILTLATALTILGDSIPALRYLQRGDSMIVWGTGDPSFLYTYVYNNQRTFQFLKQAPAPLYFSTANFFSERFGEGWAWDDYITSDQSERSAFPVYGNMVTGTVRDSALWVEPSRLATSVSVQPPADKAMLSRDERSNRFSFQPSFKMEPTLFEVPFTTSDSLLTQFLRDTLKREVKLANIPIDKSAQILYSLPADSLYTPMMQVSDNFLAEQLLLMCSGVVSDSLAVAPAIRFMQQNAFASLPDELVWVDGSGLSRYNLFTPQSIVQVWKMLYEKVPSQRLFSMLAIGGMKGTIKRWYKGNPAPYIYGKTGTLSNNHSLSGYLLTKSGKTLIFSFMNSNYLASTSDVRRSMQDILEYIRENYK
jgi:serine-type D-Ala-D-Ala carboxypeptidase/endopeptidase (penicillin-binding protein 4)